MFYTVDSGKHVAPVVLDACRMRHPEYLKEHLVTDDGWCQHTHSEKHACPACGTQYQPDHRKPSGGLYGPPVTLLGRIRL